MRPGPGYPRKVSAASPARLISIGYSRPLRLSRRLNGLYKRDSGGVTSPLKVEQSPIDRPIEYARNSRKNDAKVDQMAAAIREFGFRIPIVAKSDGSVVDGHLRLKAVRKLGLTEVPVALADELTDAQIKAFRLIGAEWDNELLALELGDLRVRRTPIRLAACGRLGSPFLFNRVKKLA